MSVRSNLCQTGTATCGACCGEFNFRDHSRQAIATELRRHTAGLRDVERTKEAFAAKAAEIKEAAPDALFPIVRVCPLLGFVDAAEEKIGCLAHPAVVGTDLRDCGVYTSDICETFTCPSYIWLDDATAELIRDACPDWYTYGLVITDVEFVRGCFTLFVNALARPVSADELRTKALPQIAALFALKAIAPDRPEGAKIFGRFEDRGEEDPHMRIIDTDALGVSPSAEDLLVLCLGYAPVAKLELLAARSLVQRHIDAVIEQLTADDARTSAPRT
ncbi:MAG: hypothetical protein ACJ790_07465 [Myxococcaceae bacterium]